MSSGMLVQCSIQESALKNLTESPLRALQGNAIPPPAGPFYLGVARTGSANNENFDTSVEGDAYPTTVNTFNLTQEATDADGSPTANFPGSFGNYAMELPSPAGMGVANQNATMAPPPGAADYASTSMKMMILGPCFGVIATYSYPYPPGYVTDIGYTPISNVYDSAEFVNIPGYYYDPSGPEANSSLEVYPPPASGTGGSSFAFFWVGLTDPSQIPIGVNMNGPWLGGDLVG